MQQKLVILVPGDQNISSKLTVKLYINAKVAKIRFSDTMKVFKVILYDNVSHERLLAMRLNEIRHAHDAVKKRAKQREESFVKLLERKQKEWIKRDSRIISKVTLTCF